MTIEARVVVLVDSMGHGICRGCKARIVWYRTIAGRAMPFDGTPTVHDARRDQTLPGAPWVGEIARTSVHWSTCPDANGFRRRRRAP